MKYYINKTVNRDFSKTMEDVQKALEDQGFGVLTDIDIQAKLKEKTGADIQKYRILGACNPPNAHKALQVENKIGTMLPCNVMVQEIDENNTEIAAIDPVATMEAIENPKLNPIAQEIKEKLENVINDV